MAISVDWGTRVITVPRADMQLVQSNPVEIRQLDLNLFRLELKNLEDDEGITYPDTHTHNQPVTVGGVTLARVVEIINNYTITFEDGQYAVNLIGANSNAADVTNVNQVSVRSANSAGLTFSEQINSQSFIGASVYIDTVVGAPGTGFPRGTATDPVDNYFDAYEIADFRNFDNYLLSGSVTLTGTDIVTNIGFVGRTPSRAQVIFDSTDVSGSAFSSVFMSGTISSGAMAVDNCRVNGISGFEGTFRDCLILDDIVLRATNTSPFVMAGCTSGVPGTDRPSLDANNSGSDIQIRNYTGGLTITNISQNIVASVDFHSGTLEIASTCIAGTIVVRGIVKLIDNSGPGCTVIADGTVSELAASGTITDQDKDDIAGRVIPHVWASSG